MRTTPGDPSSEYFAPLALFLLVLIALAGAVFLGGIWLFKPTVLPNRGMAAYKPPVGTYLLPLPHKMDAPELAQLPPEISEPAAEVVEPKPVAARPRVVHKRAVARARRDERNPAHAYADGRWGNTWGGAGGSAWGGGWGGGWDNRW